LPVVDRKRAWPVVESKRGYLVVVVPISPELDGVVVKVLASPLDYISVNIVFNS
jgi:hypothetical protein